MASTLLHNSKVELYYALEIYFKKVLSEVVSFYIKRCRV